MLSVVEEYWAVELRFDCGDVVRTHTVFESDDYEKALQKYEAFVKIVD